MTDSETPAAAHRVPWRVDERRAPVFLVTNESVECAFRVCFTYLDYDRQTQPVLVGEVESGRAFTIDAAPVFPDRVAIAILWSRADGSEYVWTFAF